MSNLGVLMFEKGIISGFASSKQQAYKEGYLLPVLEAETLLEAGRHHAIFRQLRDICGIPEEYYDAFYQAVINNFVEFVQVLPTEFDGPLCGLMNEGIARAMIAIQAYQLEHAKNIDPLKSYAVFTAALFQDISHVIMNQRVLLTEEDGNFVDYWNAFEGSMVGQADYYRMIRLAPVYQRLDYTLRHLFARQLMPDAGYQWLSSDLHLLADWFDAISGDDSQGGVLAHSLSIVKREDVVALHNSLVQVPVQQKESPSTEHGQAFYDWLRDRIDSGLTVVNTAESGLHITNEGLFLERNKLFKDFTDVYSQPVALQVVYEQFGNLMGIPKKGGYDLMHAQYFSETASDAGDAATRTFGSPISGRQASLRDGMVLSDPGMVLNNARIPSVSPLLRSMQVKDKYELPELKSAPSNAPTPKPDPTTQR